MDSMKKILLLGEIEHAIESWKSLSGIAQVVKPTALDREEFLVECKRGCLDGVLVIYRTFESVNNTGRFDRELIQCLPDSVKFVCHNGELHFSFRSPSHCTFSACMHYRVIGSSLIIC
jgi:D-3-phosphoglycerate dehydrogenase